MELTENRYDEWHASHTNDNDIETPWHNFVKSVIRSEDVENKIVLEIGCGRGGFSNYIFQRFPSLSLGRNQNQSPKISWLREDIQALSFSDQTLDTIISCETIEHITYPRKALKELYRVLRPGGRLILTCPNYFNLFGIWCLYRKVIGKPYTEGGQPYVNYIVLPVILATIKLLGFKVEHFHSSEFVIPARIPKTFYSNKTPELLKYFGSRTFYVLTK